MKEKTRRHFIKTALQVMAAAGIGGIAWSVSRKGRATGHLWQIDPRKCTQCGLCETSCIIRPSAVKCVHAFSMCGYCKLCFGYFHPQASKLDEMPQNQLCPTGAINRRFIEDPYFEYTIKKETCIGCGVCVKGCGAFGNGSLQLQVDHTLCKNCNHCTIAEACPAQAFVRVPANQPYLLKDHAPGGTETLTRSSRMFCQWNHNESSS